jgi:hypothetical protein
MVALEIENTSPESVPALQNMPLIGPVPLVASKPRPGRDRSATWFSEVLACSTNMLMSLSSGRLPLVRL